MSDIPVLRPRRSKRFQPLVNFSSSTKDEECTWLGAPILQRPTTRDDLHEEEWDEVSNFQTEFYEGFSRKNPRYTFKRGKGTKRTRKSGSEEMASFKLGDTVQVDTSARLPSIGVIMSMWEVKPIETNIVLDETRRPRIKVHWFLRPSEFPSLRPNRQHVENEIYYTLSSTDTITPSKVLKPCVVSSKLPEYKTAVAWSGSPSRRARVIEEGSDDDLEEAFCCLRATDSQRGIFYGLDWERHRHQALAERCSGWESGISWRVLPTVEPGSQNSSPKKRRKLTSDNKSGDVEEDGDDDDEVLPTILEEASSEDEKEVVVIVPKTPTKKRKRIHPLDTPSKRTPSKSRLAASKTAPVAPTPQSKAALRSRARSKKVVRPPPPQFTNMLQLDALPTDPWLRSMHVLHVGARPDALPCREEEYGRVLRNVEELLEEGSGGCVYISGVPGTGKTATVHAVVRELKRMAHDNETSPFEYIEINGLRIPEPSGAYSLLWESIIRHDTSTGHLKISSKEALKNLSKHFSGSRVGPSGHSYVVLMDELDQLMTTKQDVVYNFFNWPTLVGSRLVVIAVANTMDLPERVMTGRVRSRLGMVRVNFQPYTTPQLEKIVHARLQSAKEGLPAEDAARDVIAADGVKFASMKVSSISGDARRVLDICRRAVELVQPSKRAARTDDVKEVIKVMQNSPTAAYLRECSYHERVMLASLVKCVKREGVEEIRWSEVQYQHLIYVNVLNGGSDYKPSTAELGVVLDSLVASRAVLFEDNLAASRKLDGERRVMLNLEQNEVERVLGEVGGQSWKSVLST